MNEDAEKRMREVDAFLAETSWDHTWGRMCELIEDVITLKRMTQTGAPIGIPVGDKAATTASQVKSARAIAASN
jgi:hypothetical protein